MPELCAIEADYVNWRPVNGRKVLQLVFEVPLENTHDVLTRLGTPTPGESKWCAIALLDPDAPAKPTQAVIEGAKQLQEIYGSAPTSLQAEGGSPKKWSEYNRSQQCAILCGDPDFWRYFNCTSQEDATKRVKAHLRITSRKELDDPQLRGMWDEFLALYRLHQDRHK